MNEVLVACAIMVAVTAVFGALIAVADRIFHVEEDPRVGHVEERLAGTNCGACGEPGCHAFAEALVEGRTEPAKCSVTAPEKLAEIAGLLGVDVGEAERRVARLHCAGGRSSVRQVAEYAGVRSCRAAHVVNGGGKACAWGCLGLADCERACGFDAIAMTVEDLPAVDPALCTACGDCVEVCPLDLFTLEPESTELIVQCSAPLTGEAARSTCRVACDACGRCALDADEGVIEMSGGLAVVKDPTRGKPADVGRCPTGAIQWVEGPQFPNQRRREREEALRA